MSREVRCEGWMPCPLCRMDIPVEASREPGEGLVAWCEVWGGQPDEWVWNSADSDAARIFTHT